MGIRSMHMQGTITSQWMGTRVPAWLIPVLKPTRTWAWLPSLEHPHFGELPLGWLPPCPAHILVPEDTSINC